MKTLWMPIVMAGALGIVSCKRAEPPAAPAATPHPAKGATEAAIRLYPDLARKDSVFNLAFVELYEHQKKANPQSLTTVDWPLKLAARTAAMLEVSRYAATPVPTVIAKPNPTPTPNALERGAYNEKRSVAKPPVIRYQNGYPVQ